MKLGLGLYRHMLKKENYDFAKQCGCTHLVVHLVDYYNQVEGLPDTDTKQNMGYARQMTLSGNMIICLSLKRKSMQVAWN